MKIFSLLEVIIVDVLIYSVSVKDMVHLDSAFCNSSSRSFLLGLFEQDYFATDENSFSTDCLRYVTIRTLKLRKLSLNDSF